MFKLKEPKVPEHRSFGGLSRGRERVLPLDGKQKFTCCAAFTVRKLFSSFCTGTALKEPLSIILVKAVFISFVALFATDFGLLLYSHSTGFPTSDWGVVGRWFVMLADGQFYTPAITNEPPVAYEHFIGLSMHVLIAFVFTAAYLIWMDNKRPLLHIYCGPFFGLALAVFPLFIQLPSMGTGFLGWNSSNHFLLMVRVFVAHFSLGVGLAVGSLLMIFLLQHKN